MVSGDRPNTGPRPKPTGKKAKRLSQKEQSERFKEAARELEADESGEAFERLMDEIASKRRRLSDAPKPR
jgi:hypothetical protein